MDGGRVVILFAIARQRKKRVVDVRRIGTSSDARPIVILHQDDEDVAVGVESGANGERCCANKTEPANKFFHVVVGRRMR